MPTIEVDDTFTKVVQFEVDPSRQEALIAAIAGEVERWVRHRPGFLSSTLHASLDGHHVLNYAQWRSIEDFEAMMKNPAAAPHMEAIAAFAKYEPALYEVTETFSVNR